MNTTDVKGTATASEAQEVQTAMDGFDTAPVTSEKEKERQREKEARDRFHAAVSNEEGMGIIKSFMTTFGIAAILCSCSIFKVSGIGITAAQMFAFLLAQVFCQYSVYRREKMKTLPEGVSTSSVSRFLSNPKYRWETFLLKLAKKAFDFISNLNGPEEKMVFTADDTDVDRRIRGKDNPRAGSGKKNKKKKQRVHKGKRTELVARKYDHARHVHSSGFRMLTLGLASKKWFIPLNFVLLSSQKAKNILGDSNNEFNKNSAAYKRRALAVGSTMAALLSMLTRVLKVFKNVKYICADRWFSNPSQIFELKNQTGLHVITVLKHNTTKYVFNNVEMTLSQIFKCAKKHYAIKRNICVVNIHVPGKNGNVENNFDAKVVFIRNRAKRNEWVAILCTDVDLSYEEIIDYYSLRWKTETFFWTAKMFLGLNTECHALSYDAITAHATIVAVRYIMLTIEQCKTEDVNRSMGELFSIMQEEERSSDFGNVLAVFADCVFDVLENKLRLSQEQLNLFTDALLEMLPEKLYNYLQFASNWKEEDNEPPEKKGKKEDGKASKKKRNDGTDKSSEKKEEKKAA